MKRAALSFTIAIVAMMVTPPACWSAALTPAEVARTLDVTSFPNSIRPGLKPGTKILAQNGFTVVEPVEGNAHSVEVYLPDHSWLFKITVLGSKDDKLIVCIFDRALNGGTYRTQKPLGLRRGKDGLLHATGRAVSDPHCDKYER